MPQGSIAPDRLLDESLEWLETDGLGGFAMGTPSGLRTRRYHALLTAAATPPTGRFTLVSALEVRVRTPAGSFALSSHRYAPDVVHPDGCARLSSFECEPAPRRIFTLEDGTRVEELFFVPRGAPAAVLRWRLLEARPGVELEVRPLLAFRELHALQRENTAFRFDAEVRGERVRWHPYEGTPALLALSSGRYEHAPDWYRSFLYGEERERGLDHVEDLATPGSFRYDLSAAPAALIFRAETPADPGCELSFEQPALALAEFAWERERERRAAFASPLERAADAYIVRRGEGLSIVAGYPWFSDWGRDTFLALRGLCLATGRLEEAASILGEWAGAVSEGMLPNRFVEGGESPEYHSVDAPLWYVIAAHELFVEAERAGRVVRHPLRARILGAVDSILDGLAAGARYGIRAGADGLLAAGEPGWQLSWMDAKVDGRVVTPRIGKPVEIQALWINALRLAGARAPRFAALAQRALASFEERFWSAELGRLHDVVDEDHVPGKCDSSLRPNQVLAVAGLPFALVEGERARAIVDALERELWTPLGLRTLAPSDARYVGRYRGGPAERDRAYHQGNAWAWLLGPFVEAWVRTHGADARARRAARERFVGPLVRHLDEAGLGHVSELAEGDAPHLPRGAPFQAWSLSELLRLQLRVLGARPARGRAKARVEGRER